MATPIGSTATYSGKKFKVGDTIYFAKFGTRVDSGYASKSGDYGTCHAKISELYSSSYAFPIRITGTVTTPSSGTFTGCTVKPSDVSKGYQVTVTYNRNPASGTSGSSSQTGYVGASLTGTATRTGYTFAGWYTAASGGSKVTTIPKTANTTYYAHWTAKSYTVTFNANGGSSTTTKSETYGSKYTFPSNPTRTGYTFSGWYTAASGGSQVTTSTTVATAAAHTVYAHWTANTYYVAFNGNGATGTMTNQTHTYGTSLALSANTFDRSPIYAFKDWNTQADGTGTSYSNQQSVTNLTSTKGATVTLYAQWELQYISPSVVITHAYRSDSNGDMSDAGTYLHIEADITVDTTISTLAGTTNYVKTIKIYTKKKDANIWDSKLELNIAASELTSYHLDQVISGYLTTFSYDIRIDVTDTYGSDDLHITDPQASASDILSLAFYTLDFSAGDPNASPDPIPGGHGVGIGAPAPYEGLRVGLDTEFEGNIEVAGGGVFGDDVSVTGYNMNLENDNGDVFVTAKRSDTGAQADLGVGIGGVNHGLYSRSNDRWIIYDNDTGITRIPATDIRLAGHANGIGTIKNSWLSSAQNVPSGTWTWANNVSVSLEAGIWLITFGIRFATNTSGYRAGNTSTSKAANDYNIAALPTNSTAQLRCSNIAAPTATTTYYLNFFQNSGSTISAPASSSGAGNFIRAVRIL